MHVKMLLRARHHLQRPRRRLLLRLLLRLRLPRYHVPHNRIVRLITYAGGVHVMPATRFTVTLIATVIKENPRRINRTAAVGRTLFHLMRGVRNAVPSQPKSQLVAIRQFLVCPHRSLTFTNMA